MAIPIWPSVGLQTWGNTESPWGTYTATGTVTSASVTLAAGWWEVFTGAHNLVLGIVNSGTTTVTMVPVSGAGVVEVIDAVDLGGVQGAVVGCRDLPVGQEGRYRAGPGEHDLLPVDGVDDLLVNRPPGARHAGSGVRRRGPFVQDAKGPL